MTFTTHWIRPDWHCQSVFGWHQKEKIFSNYTALTDNVPQRFVVYVEKQLHMLNKAVSCSKI